MDAKSAADILEAAMLVCFGSSWPFSIAKALRTKTVKGKSPVFLTLIILGYVFGIGKMVCLYTAARDAAAPGEAVAMPWLIWFYAGLIVLVSTDAILYALFRKN